MKLRRAEDRSQVLRKAAEKKAGAAETKLVARVNSWCAENALVLGNSNRERRGRRRKSKARN